MVKKQSRSIVIERKIYKTTWLRGHPSTVSQCVCVCFYEILDSDHSKTRKRIVQDNIVTAVLNTDFVGSLALYTYEI